MKNNIIYIFSHNMFLFGYTLSHKQTTIACGILCQTLLIMASITVLDTPIKSIFNILFAFLIMCPISYYNMREYEKGYDRYY